ncbi:LacI family transcriptional regulator [Paenibacillus montaniterrae]|uniref:LacI family transcriptional regulator n=1 Tax=Paenibacillus montaniterrae TaxID=429341 RepID=A0A920CYX9_9BACL|nr:LacI family DNA-binding transcriptional regulator [Paenibacillus montaniterrae]GIP17870.1 LacI family transcriptional regulator [Paenibacillus montaniterrae]
MKQEINIIDVAQLAKVSIATVSNVINGKGRVSTLTEKRVRKAIDELGYAPNLLARNLKTKRSGLIGLVVPTVKPGRLKDNPFYWDLLSGVEEYARERDFHIILSGFDEAEESFEFVKERQLDGLIIVGAGEQSSAIEKVLALNIPFVFVDNYLMNPDLYQVSLDDRLGGWLATKHLLELNHRNIAVHIGDIPLERIHQYGVLHERWNGYRLALEEAGIPYDSSLMIQLPTSAEGGQEAAGWLEKHSDVTAIFSFSDIAAIGILKGLKERGVNVPQDISVVGFDDLYMTAFTSPPLTTVSQNIVVKGIAAAQLLFHQIENSSHYSRKVVLPVELKVRETTGWLNKGE